MKYIVYKIYGYELIKAWKDEEIAHIECYDSIRSLNEYSDISLVSAGFVKELRNGDKFCCGKSKTLNVDSRPLEDTELYKQTYMKQK